MREPGGKTLREILRTGPFSQNSNFKFHSNVDSIIDNKEIYCWGPFWSGALSSRTKVP